MTDPTWPPLPGGGQPHPQPSRLCDTCRAEFDRWYDYRLDRPAPFTSQSNYDRIPEGVADNRRAGYEQWRDTVRYQQDLIRQHCAEQHQQGTLRIGSLFSGYGGLDQAVRAVLGGRLAWVSDIDPGACAVLAHHHPDVPNLGDVAAIDWAMVEPVDVLAAGFPCQDISNAGRHAGIEGKRSGLWAHVADAISVVRPRLVVLENVAALVVRGLDRVLADLAALGFDAEWTTVRASDIGAPHRRERWFLLAWPSRAVGVGSNPDRPGREGPEPAGRPIVPARCAAADTDRVGRERPGPTWDGSSGPAHRGESAAHPHRSGLRADEHHLRPGQPDSGRSAAADGDGARQQQLPGRLTYISGRFDDRPAEAAQWGEYGPAIHRWAEVLGRPAPTPTISGSRGKPVLNPSFTTWMQGLPDGYLTQVAGLSRGALIRLCGNGVVPQQGAAAITHLLARTHLSAAAA